jgi:Ca-activated chloride channel family protein
MFARLRSPRLDDVHIAWPSGTEPLWASPVRSTVFDSDAVSVYAVLGSPLVGTVRLAGRRDGGAIESLGEITFTGENVASQALPRMAASARIAEAAHADGAGRADALQLALYYQLVSAETHLLLVHERADGSKAMDIPVLRKVANTVPAGWAGTASVKLRVATDIAAFSVDPGGYSQMAVPSIWRTNRVLASAKVLHTYDADFEIPAFLRRVEDSVTPDTRRSSDDHGLRGLRPWDLVLRLRALPPAAAPRRYAELIALGLDPWLVEWLELVVAGGLDEAGAVRSFVWIMSQARAAASSSGRLALPAAATVDAATRRVLAALDGVEADRWPDCVFSLDSPATVSAPPAMAVNG